MDQTKNRTPEGPLGISRLGQSLEGIDAGHFLDRLSKDGRNWVEAFHLESLLSLQDFGPVYQAADQLRRKIFGDYIDIRAILEFSNYCRRQCQYCGLNRENKKLIRYRMEEEEILQVVKAGEAAGYKTIVLQSGEDPYYTKDKLVSILQGIKRETNLFITVSCGERALSDYEEFKQAGADRYLLKHETAEKQIYDRLHPCGTLQNRVTCLQAIKKAGLETGSGFMIGLPGQTLATIAKDILLLRDLQVDMAGIGPFIPSPDTVLADQPPGSTELTKRAVALTRLMVPYANLPATTSLGVLDSSAKDSVFSCGANVIMRKITPQKYEEHYSIYPNQIKVDNLNEDKKTLDEFIRSLGRIPR